MIGKWAHTIDDRFTGEFDTREDAISDGIFAYEGQDFRVGQVCHAMDLVSFDADVILENVECELYDQIGYEEQIVELTKQQKEELSQVVCDYLRKHAHFNSHGMTNVEFVEVGDDSPE